MNRAVMLGLSLLAVVVWWTGGNQGLFLQWHHAMAVVPGVAWRLVSMAGEWTLVSALLLWQASRQPVLLPRMVGVLLAGIFASIGLKAGFEIARPPLVLPAGSVTLLDVLPGNGSFPSGHAVAVGVLAGAWPCGRGGRLALLLLVLLVCLSRIAIGVHWPLDVLVGAAIGFGLAWASANVMWRGWPPRWGQRALTSLALLLAGVSLWKLAQPAPNEAYWLYNLIVLGLCVVIGLRRMSADRSQ